MAAAAAEIQQFSFFQNVSPWKFPVPRSYLWPMLCSVQVGVPGSAERADILQKQLSLVPCSATTAELTQLADAAHGYVGADLAAVCKEAGK